MSPQSLTLITLCTLLLAISFPQAAIAGTVCGPQLQAMSQNLIDFTNSMNYQNEAPGLPTPFNVTLSNDNQNFLAFSGRFFNDFGEYEVCQNLTISHYLTLVLTANALGQSIPAVIGFCGPIGCSQEDATLNMNTIFKLYQQGMGLPFTNASVTNSSVSSFYDPMTEAPGSQVATGIVIGIFCLIGVLVVAGTIFGIMAETKGAARKPGLEQGLLRETEINNNLPASEINQSQATITQSEISGTNTYNNSAVTALRPNRELRGIYKLIDCFDARKNFGKLITVRYTDSYDYNLEIFNGIRVFMMLYVVFGHSFLFGTSYIDNLPDINDFAGSWWMLILNAALFSVDVFFYMSGFLFAYIGLGKLKKMRVSFLSYVGLAVHRWLRIWPAYALAILFFWRILPLMGSGPVWFEMTQTTALCDDTVWQNLLFLDDFLVQSANYCYGWGWYLSNDFQMFLITPFFLWFYIRRRRLGKLAMLVLMIASWIAALVIGANLGVKANPPKTGGVTNPQAFSQYYVKPYIRLPPYFIGVLAALMYKEYKEKIGSSYKIGHWLEKSPHAKNVVAFFGVIIMLLLTFLPRQVQFDVTVWPNWFHVAFRAFQKSLYVVGLTMLITPILLGDKTLLKRFLSHPILVPLARLSFSAYLVHLFWVYKNYYEMPFSYHFTFGNGVLNTLSNATIAFLTGLLYCLIIEVPMGNIESKYVSGARRSRPKKKEPLAEQSVASSVRIQKIDVDEE